MSLKYVMITPLFIVFLLFAFFNLAYVLADSEIHMLPTDDAHVLADLNDPNDSTGLMQLNTGTLDSIQLLSAWNVTENQNVVVSVAYLKFDLTKHSIENLEKATLNMLTRDVALSEGQKNVALVHVSNNNWKESDITYIKRPFFPTTVSASTNIETPNTWYSWDITDLIKKNPSSELSVALTFETATENAGEVVSFYSKEFSNQEFAPYLELSYSSPPLSFQLSEGSSDYALTVIISGITGAISACIVTLVILSTKKHGLTQQVKSQTDQHKTQTEKVTCKVCGKVLPKQFKYCPFCSTRTDL